MDFIFSDLVSRGKKVVPEFAAREAARELEWVCSDGAEHE